MGVYVVISEKSSQEKKMKLVKSNERTTLLLDSSWMPVNVLTARAAFSHLLKGRVTGLDKMSAQFDFDKWNDFDSDTGEHKHGAEFHGNQPCIASASDIWPLPTIVVVTEKFFRKPRTREYSFNE